ncbi:MAG: tRNA dihydrouridine(20/20a) synthase DusA [Methylocystis sp.]|nr:tRNA dihydrouridine(20/20a) synthase DusA [Methylocystis sp.]MCA3582666.1 tRNA dihydrouridine(20/20a) synthase DusA [Methylocystis sp.]MCA3588669.1 tRNA dihydrouridine(20/20a) synthase DusA [Methylocystis sp.]MCA3591963.1 tRNA dihydrouridine(20/20a) synthase DusA [Methylocystis sp.]
MMENKWKFSIAPMMDWTDRHCRSFHRILSRRARLYTEMVTPGAVIHGDRARIIGFGAHEQPVAVQLGGSEPAKLAEAARICAAEGYAEINLNCGCPSDRVQGGHFGACLMREPDLVAECVAAMKAAVPIPVTVKCRIGVDDQDPEEALFTLAEKVIAAGSDAMVVHARKAWLQGLSPKENREVPPLDYALVHRLKRAFPAQPMAINGGIATLAEGREQLAIMDGIMVGRAAYQNPEMLLGVDPELFGEPAPVADAFEALAAFRPYVAEQLEGGVRLHSITKHLLGLFPGRPGARLYRRYLSTEGLKPGAGLGEYDAAIAIVRGAMARREEDVAA